MSNVTDDLFMLLIECCHRCVEGWLVLRMPRSLDGK
jgi:hypothetical protein